MSYLCVDNMSSRCDNKSETEIDDEIPGRYYVN